MTLRYRVLCGLAVLGFAGLGQPVLGQVVPTAEDSLKGKIWTTTARRVWLDAKISASTPKKWDTLQDFMSWLMAKPNADLAKQSELGVLQRGVVDRIKQENKGSLTGTPEQLSEAILAVIAKQHEEKKGALGRINPDILRAELNKNLPVASATTVEATAKASGEPLAAPAATKAAVAGQDLPEYPDQNPDNLVRNEQELIAPRAEQKSFFADYPYMIGVLCGLLGAVLGIGAGIFFRKDAPSNTSAGDHVVPSQPFAPTVMQSPEYKKLRQAYDKLQTQVHRLEKQLADLKAQVAGKSAPNSSSTPVPTPEFEPADADLLSPMPLAAIPVERPSQPQAVTRYGPVQETPFLEDRKIADSALPQLALMLTMHPSKPDQASFTLNPQVNQAMLIGDGLNRLQKFFEYDPPIGRISSVTAAAPGRLQRHADGWQVVERARLTIR